MLYAERRRAIANMWMRWLFDASFDSQAVNVPLKLMLDIVWRDAGDDPAVIAEPAKITAIALRFAKREAWVTRQLWMRRVGKPSITWDRCERRAHRANQIRGYLHCALVRQMVSRLAFEVNMPPDKPILRR